MLRGFTDSAGAAWQVWEVFPAAATDNRTRAEAMALASLKETAFENGWLCFESEAEKRRLAPIPQGWAFTEPSLLAQLCSQAAVVPIRQRHANGNA